MSYGIWRKSGKGWCSIEIDSPGNNDSTLRDYRFKNDASAWRLIDQLDSYGIRWSWEDDIEYLRWFLNQLKTQPLRSIVEVWSGGEHVKWVASETEGQLKKSMVDSPEDKVTMLFHYSEGHMEY
jgi:hypothetical protein